jgi:ABC-2 type transport system ATP-binding protein
MTAAIATEGLTKRFRGVDALTDLTLEVPKGSIFGFLGPNGAGKTTTLKLLAGLSRATAGGASVNGVPISLQGAHRAQIGYLAQEPRFYGWMTGRQTLAYVGSFYRQPMSRGRIDELLELVGIADAADRPTKTYSGGMRQRLGIGQALAGDPSVLLLDEPAASLDPLGRHDVLELMRRLRGDKTIFYSTHILDDVQRVSDHVAIVDRGRLVMTAPTAELVQRSSGGTIQVGLVGATPDIERSLAAIPGVDQVRVAGRNGDEWRYELTPAAGATADVQQAVTRLAGELGLALTTNRQETLDLEDIFLRIVNEERAA